MFDTAGVEPITQLMGVFYGGFEPRFIEGFDTVLGGLFGLGGGGLPMSPWYFVEEKNIVKPGGSQIQAKSGVSGGFEPRFRGFLAIFGR